MNLRTLFDLTGAAIFVISSLLIFIFMLDKTSLLFDSLLGGILGGALCWLSYLTCRICYLASKKNK